jgi:metal-sulfur cluster biosynthetic enzyme
MDTPAESQIDSPDATGASGADGADAPAGGVTLDQAKLVLRRVKDPELNLNIVDLGLIYDIQVDGADINVDMSLTSPGCPSGPEIMGEAEKQLRTVPGVGEVKINLIWSPPWTPDRIEPRVRTYLGF